jgi:hypothetical protein
MHTVQEIQYYRGNVFVFLSSLLAQFSYQGENRVNLVKNEHSDGKNIAIIMIR